MSVLLELALNQTLFREVNERVIELGQGFDDHGSMREILCECSHTDCMDTFEVSRDEYEAVRARPLRFFISPGHEIPEIERVVDEGESFVVVEKFVDPSTAPAA